MQLQMPESAVRLPCPSCTHFRNPGHRRRSFCGSNTAKRVMCECLASACFGLARRAFRAHAQALPAWQYAPQRLLLGQPCTSPSTHPHALPCSQPPRPNSPRSAVSWLVSLRCSYAFGLIMWELLTWELPFAEMSTLQVGGCWVTW